LTDINDSGAGAFAGSNGLSNTQIAFASQSNCIATDMTQVLFVKGLIISAPLGYSATKPLASIKKK
jgi:hypothetical protein